MAIWKVAICPVIPKALVWEQGIDLHHGLKENDQNDQDEISPISKDAPRQC